MNKEKAREFLESCNISRIGGEDLGSLAQVIENSLNPDLLEHIRELHYGRRGMDFSDYYSRHRRIVDFFERMRVSDFSLDELHSFFRLDERVEKTKKLTYFKQVEADKKKTLGVLQEYLDQITPLLIPEKALEYARRSYLPVLSSFKSNYLVPVGNLESESEVNENYCVVLLRIDQTNKEIEQASKERLNHQKTFTILTQAEAAKLDAFVQNRDGTKYCTNNYLTQYCAWRLAELRKGIITINVIHRFE